MTCRIVQAGWFWSRVLGLYGGAGITMPWRTIYLMKQYIDHEGLIAHELVHIEQIERDGPVVFSLKYLWWCLRYGYWANPYEIEAYAKAPLG